jgi:hypothetical protein
MHVMTGNHAAHGNHPAAVQLAGVHAHTGPADARQAHEGHAAAAPGHTEAVHPGPVAAPAGHAAAAADITPCSGSCHRVQESGASCIPSAKASALTVFPPHESGLHFRAVPAGHTGPAAAFARTPPSPTPCELSISRT